MAKLGYVKQIDYINLSYSKILTLHSCPRKFELKELEERGEYTSTIPTAYGHAWMGGVQELFRSESFERAIVAAYSYWPFGNTQPDKYKRSFGMIFHALEQFYAGPFQELIAEWKLPPDGIEHLFLIEISKPQYDEEGKLLIPGFNYQGHIDLILQHREDNRLAVFEGKTTTMNVSEATYANSAQTGGYQVVLNDLAARLDCPNSGEVNYLVQRPQDVLNYEEGFGFTVMPFLKGRKAAIDFLHTMLSEVERIQHYIRTGFFPKYGESCTAYGRPCHFFGMCNMQNLQDFMQTEHYEPLGLEEVHSVISLDTLIEQIGSINVNEELDHVRFF